MKITIVIPAYNEEGNIRVGKLKMARDFCQIMGYSLLVVDDGSTDMTPDLTRCLAIRLVKISHAGKAGAVIEGIRADAASDVVVVMDMDQAVPIEQVTDLVEPIVAGEADIVIGNRGLRRAGAPLSRYILSWGHMALRYILTGLSLHDTQCGFKAFKTAAALETLQHLVIYDAPKPSSGPNVSSGFDVEMLLVAKRLGYQIVEVPVEWHYQETRRVHAVRDAYRGALGLVGIAAARLTGQYPRRATTAKFDWGTIFVVLFLILIDNFHGGKMIFTIVVLILNLMAGAALGVSLNQFHLSGDVQELVVWFGFASAVAVIDYFFGQSISSLIKKPKSDPK